MERIKIVMTFKCMALYRYDNSFLLSKNCECLLVLVAWKNKHAALFLRSQRYMYGHL